MTLNSQCTIYWSCVTCVLLCSSNLIFTMCSNSRCLSQICVIVSGETEWRTAVHGLDGKCRPPQLQSLSSDDALCRRRSSRRVLPDYIRDANNHWSSFQDIQGTTLTRFLQWPRCQRTMRHNDWWLRRWEKCHQNGLPGHYGTTLHVPRPAGDVAMALGCQAWNSACWSTRIVSPVQAVDVRK